MKHKGFILELALDAAVFLVCASVCCALTVAAHLDAEKSGKIVRAVSAAQSAAELHMAGKGQSGRRTEDGLQVVVEPLPGGSVRIVASDPESGEILYEIPEVPCLEN